MKNDLLEKYDIPAPRYTSYPTVPYWEEPEPGSKEWTLSVQRAFSENEEISLYIHLPFCERLCTYCGCNKRITKRHSVEQPYIQALLKEWKMYLDILPKKPVLKEIHLGGGTPTFFSPDNLSDLLQGIFAGAIIPDEAEFGFEAHPNSTTREHLEKLYELGFRRLSIGVQDFNDEILKIINRTQTTEDVLRVTREAREIGYESINYDIIFGLPLQTKDDIRANIEKIKQLKPERIAFYSYAHVPWIKPSQRAYSVEDLPRGNEKRELYDLGRELLESVGYHEIGMDHFALEKDELYKSLVSGKLHRNFMGYTSCHTKLSIGLGASSISDSWDVYVQNDKDIDSYQQTVNEGRFPIIRGHMLTEEDSILRQHILNIMCRFETSWSDPAQQCDTIYEGQDRLAELEKDGLVETSPFHLKVTEKGRPFLRNICLAFDARYWRKKPEGQLFSSVV